MILILTEDDDGTVDQVERLLRRRGAPFLRFNNARFPDQALISVSYSDERALEGTLAFDGRRFDLAGFSTVWERRPDPPAIPASLTRGMSRRFSQHECSRFIEDVWQTLECRWLPAPTATVRRVEEKLTQLEVADALGFELPPTLITNDPDEFLEFYREHNGRIVSKVFNRKLLQPECPDEPRAFRVFTEIVSSRAVGYASSIRHAPVVFQAYVPKRSELRVTVVGQRVFAAEIFSQANHRTRHDWRRYDQAHTPYRPFQLPERLEQQCIALLERLGLSFGAIDLVRTPDDRYVFLEINPRGEWQWIEALTGMPIGEAIGDWLMDSRKMETAHDL